MMNYRHIGTVLGLKLISITNVCLPVQFINHRFQQIHDLPIKQRYSTLFHLNNEKCLNMFLHKNKHSMILH